MLMTSSLIPYLKESGTLLLKHTAATNLYVRSSPRSPLTSGWNCWPFSAQHLPLPCMQDTMHHSLPPTGASQLHKVPKRISRFVHSWSAQAMSTGRIDIEVGRLMQAEGGVHLIAKAPQREGSEGVIELHDGAEGSHCSLVHAGALAIWACRAVTHLSHGCHAELSLGVHAALFSMRLIS